MTSERQSELIAQVHLTNFIRQAQNQQAQQQAQHTARVQAQQAAAHQAQAHAAMYAQPAACVRPILAFLYGL